MKSYSISASRFLYLEGGRDQRSSSEEGDNVSRPLRQDWIGCHSLLSSAVDFIVGGFR